MWKNTTPLQPDGRYLIGSTEDDYAAIPNRIIWVERDGTVAIEKRINSNWTETTPLTRAQVTALVALLTEALEVTKERME
jgi:hypothetical protein